MEAAKRRFTSPSHVARRRASMHVSHMRRMARLPAGPLVGNCHSSLSDILTAVDCSDFAALILLNLSTALNTVDHIILLNVFDGRSVSRAPRSVGWSYLTRCTECAVKPVPD
jgi:hypothetical protein